MIEYQDSFCIGDDLVTAIDHEFDNGVLFVLCKPKYPRGSLRTNNSPRNAIWSVPKWFDVTTLPDEVCGHYYSKSF